MKAWREFFPDVLPYAGAMPEVVVEHHIRRAAQEFCERTRAWVVDLDEAQTQDGQTEYDLELPSDVELVRIESATLDGRHVALWRSGAGRGRYVFTPDGKTLRTSWEPDGGSAIVIRASLKPGNAATGIEDVLFDRYLTPIALCARSKVAGDGGALAAFNDACERIKVDLWRGNAAIRPRTRPHFF